MQRQARAVRGCVRPERWSQLKVHGLPSAAQAKRFGLPAPRSKGTRLRLPARATECIAARAAIGHVGTEAAQVNLHLCSVTPERCLQITKTGREGGVGRRARRRHLDGDGGLGNHHGGGHGAHSVGLEPEGDGIGSCRVGCQRSDRHRELCGHRWRRGAGLGDNWRRLRCECGGRGDPRQRGRCRCTAW